MLIDHTGNLHLDRWYNNPSHCKGIITKLKKYLYLYLGKEGEKQRLAEIEQFKILPIEFEIPNESSCVGRRE